MPDIEAPDSDVAEQQDYQPTVGPADLALETPEADAVEQQQDAGSGRITALPGLPDGVPEADALEQSHPVEFDEDDYRS
ncbi:MAG TPA: hypothetical protein VEZ46_04875 [Mycobacteriales bacterium]|jgi:hypothetical protein|nr:hypothetical protein [Mycobacteriales bacterium]